MELETQTSALLDSIVEDGVCLDRESALRYCVEQTWLSLHAIGDESPEEVEEIRSRIAQLDRGEGQEVNDLDTHFGELWQRALSRHEAKTQS